jgi:uncharacterized membrane protein
MEALMYVAIGLGSVNSVILAALIYLYAKIALRTRASYSVGLAIFGGLLLVHNLLTVFAYSTMSPLFGSEALPYLSAMGAAELGGLVVLLRLTV